MQPIGRPSLFAFVFASLLVASCYSPNVPDGKQQCTIDDKCPEGYFCGPLHLCYKTGTKPTCPSCSGSTPVCDSETLTCVGCLKDGDCPAGKLCSGKMCRDGCSSQKPTCAGDAGSCDVDAGVCRGCLDDKECSGGTPRCDTAGGACVACLQNNDNCGQGTYCDKDQSGAWACLTGCKSKSDCVSGGGDGGTGGGDGGTGGGGMECCAHKCIDTSRDDANCGACGTACTGGRVCCGGGCTDITSDANHCGGCGMGCAPPNANATCANSMCAVGGCKTGFADCDGKPETGCEINTTSDPLHCGMCNMKCPAVTNGTPGCTAGVCGIGMCTPPFRNCDNMAGNGCETNGNTDINHCGACNNKCATLPNSTPACASGTCGIGACVGAYRNCDNITNNGCEANSAVDINHCGACNNKCATLPNSTPGCSAGVCGIGSCTGTFRNCDNTTGNGCETNVANTVAHCGACNSPCSLPNATPICSNGVCTIAACTTNFGNCDGVTSTGCEANFLTNNSHCGGCNKPCATGTTCTNGTCVSSGTPRTIPGFSGQLGPDFSSLGYTQCVGYLDAQNVDDIPNSGWATPCVGTGYNRLRLACGASAGSVRYIDVSRNVFATGLNSYPEAGLITGSNFTVPENNIWASGNQPNTGTSWWGSGTGCGETNANITINNGCPWDASNCFGQGLTGNRYLYVYVHN